MIPPLVKIATVRYPNGDTFKYDAYLQGSSGRNSPRVKGDLVLRANPFSMDRRSASCSAGGGERFFRKPVVYPPEAGGVTKTYEIWQPISSSCYSSFRRKVYSGGNAALGVTLGSWKQSALMIASKSTRIIAEAADILSYRRRGGYRARDKIANKHLEIVFGWQPLVQDIAEAVKVFTNPIPSQWVSVTKTGILKHETSSGPDWSGWSEMTSFHGKCSVNHAAAVHISNPNLWLAEKLGLLNGAQVAWDLVPWSFVIGMFGNINQMLGSLTDFTGLTFDNSSRTVTMLGTWNYQGFANDSFGAQSQGFCKASSAFKWKDREINSLPTPSFSWRVPDVNIGLVATAFSLASQQATRAIQRIEHIQRGTRG